MIHRSIYRTTIVGLLIALAAFYIGMQINQSSAGPSETVETIVVVEAREAAEEPCGLPTSPAITQEGFIIGQPASATRLDDPTTEFVTASVNGYYPDSDIVIASFQIGKDYAPRIYIVDNKGRVLDEYHITNKIGGALSDRRMLPDGSIMFTIYADGAYVINREGTTIWAYMDCTVTHHAESLPNGNVLVAGSDCDCVKEIDWDTLEVVWEWNARESFGSYDSEEYYIGGSYPEYNFKSPYRTYMIQSPIFGDDWTHLNSTQKLPNGNYLASLRNFDLVVEIDANTKEIVWSFGPGIIKQQHAPKVLADNSMLVYDNGNGRVIRLDRATGEIVWEYGGLFAPFLGDASLLSDGNYMVLDTTSHKASDNHSKILIVDTEGQVLWKLINPDRNLYRAHLPGLDAPGASWYGR